MGSGMFQEADGRQRRPGMKKFTKFLCGTALVFAVTGCAFCIASICAGFGSSDMQQVMSAGSRQLQEAKHLLNGHGSGPVSQDEAGYEDSYTDIRDLKIDAAVAECLLVPYDGEEIEVTGYRLPSGFVCEQSGSTLHIKTSKQVLDYFSFRQEASSLEIRIPERLIFENLEIDAGVGEVSTDGMVSCRKADVECGVGSCMLQLNVRDKLDLNCGVGEIDLILAGQKKDYNYKMECGIGSIQIDGDTFSELGGKQKIDHGTDREIDVECGIGSVSILFEDSFVYQGGYRDEKTL